MNDNFSRAKMRLERVRKIKYPIEIIEDLNIGKCAAYEGKIRITTSAIENLSEEELAFIIAHEEAHLDKKHGEKKLEYINSCIKEIDDVVYDEKYGFFSKLLGIVFLGGVSVMVSPLKSKRHEIEADLEAKKRMIEAGYSQEDVTKFLDRIGGSSSERYFSSHPTNQLRKNMLKE